MGELALKYLAPPNEILDIDRLGAWIYVSLSAAIYFENQSGEKLIKQVENKLEELKETKNYSIELQLAYAQGLVNMISDYETAQEFGKAGGLLEKLAAIREIKLQYAQGLLIMIDAYKRLGLLDKLDKKEDLLRMLDLICEDLEKLLGA